MKKIILFMSCILLGLSACKKVNYEWEGYTYTAVPVVTVDTALSALPTRQTAKVSFFNLKDPDLANEKFSFTLNWQGYGKAAVQSIEVYDSFNKAEASVPGYPIVMSYPGGIYPNIAQFPLPGNVGAADKLYETVTSFPKTYTFTAAQLATLTGISLGSVSVNDYFIFKFIVNLTDGRRIAAYFSNVADESRNEFGDPRTGVRFKSQ
ncbi:MAG TPA: hypothetical protein VGC08_05800 [Pedobacter sp.]|jgi:hypothetical protein